MAEDKEYTIEELDDLIKLNPNDVKLYLERADIYKIRGYKDKAFEDYTQAINLENNNPELYFERGFFYDSVGEWEKALTDYTTAINLSEDARYYYYRSEAYSAIKEYQKADDDLKKIIELGEADVNLFVDRGELLTNKMKNYNEALQNYNYAITASKNNELMDTPGWEVVELYLRRGIINEILKNYDDAINDYKETYDCDIFDKKIERIKYKQQLNEVDKKIQELGKKISENPKDKTLYIERAKNYSQIVTLYQKIKTINDEIDDYDEKCLPIVVTPKEREKNIKIQWDNAIKDYTMILALDNADSLAYKKRGNLYLLTNKYKEALADYTKYSKFQPNDKDLEYDIKLLKVLTGKIKPKDGYQEFKLNKDELAEYEN